MRSRLIVLTAAVALCAWPAFAEEWNAIRQMEQQADAGDPEKQYTLGLWHFWALPDLRDINQAVYWFCRAAQGGHRASQIHLGMMYWTGGGVPRDLTQAWVWFDLAARTIPGIAADYRDRIERDAMTELQLREARMLEAAWLNTPQCPMERAGT
jgi:TPR repeat protein